MSRRATRLRMATGASLANSSDRPVFSPVYGAWPAQPVIGPPFMAGDPNRENGFHAGLPAFSVPPASAARRFNDGSDAALRPGRAGSNGRPRELLIMCPDHYQACYEASPVAFPSGHSPSLAWLARRVATAFRAAARRMRLKAAFWP